MIDTLVLCCCFLLGIFLAIQLAGAVYGIIDHAYRLRRFARRVAAGILVWGGVYALMLAILPPSARSAFLSGLYFFLGCHLLLMLAAPLPLIGAKRTEAKAYRMLVGNGQASAGNDPT